VENEPILCILATSFILGRKICMKMMRKQAQTLVYFCHPTDATRRTSTKTSA
jgi:hypothetical protein